MDRLATESGSEEHFSMEDLEKEFGFAMPEVQEGSIVEAEVVLINNNSVFCGIAGAKAEGEVPLEEFEEPPKVGDKIQVLLKRKEGLGGRPFLSKSEADKNSVLAELGSTQLNQVPISGKIDSLVKGGFRVSLGGDVSAFLPLSQFDVVRIPEPETAIGNTYDFLVDRVSQGRGGLNVVLSRKNLLQKEIDTKRAAFFETTEVGDVVKGIVKSFTTFGAFIDIGGFDGLLHVNDMSWGHVRKPETILSLSEEVELKVIKLDYDNRRINLSLRHMKPDPWETFEERYQVDQKVSGKVSKLVTFGAFVEIEEGIEGLIHVSELSWVKKVRHPKDVLSLDQPVECVILGYDIGDERISLGLRQTMENPWQTIDELFPVNKQVKAKVIKTLSSGAIVELEGEEGVEAFLPVQEISWVQRVKNVSDFFKEGDDIECVVLEIDKDKQKLRVGYRQISENPWTTLLGNYGVGAEVEGEVTSITDFGLFLKVEGDIEGLIHRNEFQKVEEGADESSKKEFKVGDKLLAVITNLDIEKQKLSLSIRQLGEMKERREISQYMDSDGKNESTGGSMADFVKPEEE